MDNSSGNQTFDQMIDKVFAIFLQVFMIVLKVCPMFLKVFIIFRERQPPNGGCREPNLAARYGQGRTDGTLITGGGVINWTSGLVFVLSLIRTRASVFFLPVFDQICERIYRTKMSP